MYRRDLHKGHNYITALADIDTRRAVYATPGKDKAPILNIRGHFQNKGVDPEQITDACVDMSPSFISGLLEYFPSTSITFDKFYVVKLLHKAMGKLRKLEYKEHEVLKRHKYTLLKKDNKLSTQQKQDREMLIELLPTIGKAYRLKTLFGDFWDFNAPEEGASFLAY